METKFEFHTQDYTYKYLPKDPKGDPILTSILTDALDYDNVFWVRISKEYYDHLSKELHFTEPDQDDNIKFYYDLSEGYISVRNKDQFIDLLFFIDSHDSIENQIYTKITRSTTSFHKQGLHTYLDPNHGGSISKQSLEIASLIIFG